MVTRPETSKCPHCRGWAFEPEHYPMKPCVICEGTGKLDGKMPVAKAA